MWDKNTVYACGGTKILCTHAVGQNTVYVHMCLCAYAFLLVCGHRKHMHTNEDTELTTEGPVGHSQGSGLTITAHAHLPVIMTSEVSCSPGLLCAVNHLYRLP